MDEMSYRIVELALRFAFEEIQNCLGKVPVQSCVNFTPRKCSNYSPKTSGE